MEDIQLITGHTPTQDARLAVRRYIESTPRQPEAQKVIDMALTLLKCVWTHMQTTKWLKC